MSHYPPYEVAKALAIDRATLRRWSNVLAPLLSPAARRELASGRGARHRRYTAEDLALLRRASALLAARMTYQQVLSQLTTVPAPPHAPALVDPTSPSDDIPGEPAILLTRLAPPPHPTEILSRLRLLNQLTGAVQLPLTLVAAPTGYGKTTLLADWRSQSASSEHEGLRKPAAENPSLCAPLRSQFKIAWLTLNASDNDSRQLWRYLAVSLDLGWPGAGVGAALRALLAATPQPSPEALVATLINPMVQMPGGVYVLVLDDYHLITNEAIHHTLAALIDQLPPPLRLVLSTRSDPPLPLARLRARGRLAELRAAELRCSADEVHHLLIDILGLALRRIDTAALAARTEGWLAGLQIAALALRGQPDLSAAVQAFSGSHRHLTEYLAHEVLDQLPAQLQTFLLQTSILDRLCADLCDALRDERPMTDAQRLTDAGQHEDEGAGGFVRRPSSVLLAELERANLFLVPLDDAGDWFRYHPLFAEVLRRRLAASTDETTIRTLYQRACAWYEAAGLTDEAITAALAGRLWPQAARLIVQAGLRLLAQGEHTRIQHWVAALPEAERLAAPGVCVLAAWGHLLAGRTAPVLRLLPSIEQALSAAPEPSLTTEDLAQLHGLALVLDALLARLRGDYAGAIAGSRQALTRLPPTDPLGRSQALLNLGSSYRWSAQPTEAAEAYAQAAQVAEQTPLLSLRALSLYGDVLVEQGRLAQAYDVYQRALRRVALLTQADLPPLPATGYPHAWLGHLLYEWNDLAQAEWHLREAATRGEPSGALDLLGYAYAGLARVAAARGEPAAGTLRARYEDLLRQSDLPLYAVLLSAEQARDAIRAGDHIAIARWVQVMDEAPSPAGVPRAGNAGTLNRLNKTVPFTLVWARISLGQDARALAELAALRQVTQRAGQRSLTIELLILTALAHAAASRPTAAQAALAHAVTLAEPGGYIRTFVDYGVPLATLLAALRPHEVPGAYVRHLQAAYAAERTLTSPFGAHDQPPVAPLSPREREVLTQIARGASNVQIAAQLVVSLATVKKHVSAILLKLNAASRTAAVARARTQGLLDEQV